MELTTISEITSSSFRITWNQDEEPELESRTLYLYEGNSSHIIFTVPNISDNGSHLFTGLKPNVTYRAVIQTHLTGSSVDVIDTKFATTLQLEQDSSGQPTITASQIPQGTKNKAVYWVLGVFTTLFLIIIAAVKRSREAVE